MRFTAYRHDQRMALAQRLRALGLDPHVDVPLARRGYWRLGGPADVLVDISTVEQLAALLALGAPVSVIGNGSNLLVSDAGVRGVVVRLIGSFRSARFQVDADHGPVIRSGAGLLNSVLLRRLADHRWGGLAPLAGVPGSIGGAIRMNAGTTLGEIGDRVIDVEVARADGTLATLSRDRLAFSYRKCALPPGAVVTEARFAAIDDADQVAAERAAIERHLARRRETQPLDQPSCGSVFRNPPGDHAGRLLDAAGLKGRAEGGARVSDKHANFIVNTGGATAGDVYLLILEMRRRVWDQFGVLLEPEVHPIGEWPDLAWPLPHPSIGLAGAPGAR